jgi:purine-binding chemotaxis protein CheW
MSKSSPIVEQQLAVSSYLDDMLNENISPDDSPEAPTPDKWKKSCFRALIINVQGLYLAIPEYSLENIQLFPKDIADKTDNEFGSPITKKAKLNIIDTSKIVLPPNYQKELESPKFIITLTKANWALSCNTISKTIEVQPNSVKWKQQSGKRPWLAGMLVEHKCGILDTTALIKHLKQ